MVGWHHRLDGHEFEQALVVGDRQGGLACCSPLGRKELDTTELNRTDPLQYSWASLLAQLVKNPPAKWEIWVQSLGWEDVPEKGTADDEMVGWHHRLNGHEFEQAAGVGDGQGSLACCSAWGCKDLDTIE